MHISINKFRISIYRPEIILKSFKQNKPTDVSCSVYFLSSPMSWTRLKTRQSQLIDEKKKNSRSYLVRLIPEVDNDFKRQTQCTKFSSLQTLGKGCYTQLYPASKGRFRDSNSKRGEKSIKWEEEDQMQRDQNKVIPWLEPATP